MPLDSHPPAERAAAPIAAERAPPPLYVSRTKVYPARVKGTIRRTKWAVLIVCLAVYYLVPWLRWDRGPGHPDQAVLVDMAGRRAYFFAIEIWPQEIYYITGLLILAAVGLFFVTSMFGRLWCGFTCPQTVWTDLFIWTELRACASTARR
jgi:polyferredoxin